ncbi:hypothetical protein GCM10010430_60560 [Kitasatospora cystarginea]|uniref:Uncharacterized protein n=1 Tax=Kitasatospora cystarginea TaxID=58350 RepID=A0ABP5RPS8_9ACTN
MDAADAEYLRSEPNHGGGGAVLHWRPENEQRIAELGRLAAQYAATRQAAPSSAQAAWSLPGHRSSAAGRTRLWPPSLRPISAERAYGSGAASRARGR